MAALFRLAMVMGSLLTFLPSAVADRRGYPREPDKYPAPTVHVKVLNVTGTGCPRGEANAVLSPDLSTVSVFFDSFVAELPPTPTPLVDKKSCMVKLGFRFSGKYRIAFIGSDVRGFYSVPQGAKASIDIQHYSIYTHKPKDLALMNKHLDVQGPAEDSVLLQSNFAKRPLWSQCGTQISQNGGYAPLMTINMTLEVQNQSAQDNVMAAIDSLDFSGDATMRYHLTWTYDKQNCPR